LQLKKKQKQIEKSRQFFAKRSEAGQCEIDAFSNREWMESLCCTARVSPHNDARTGKNGGWWRVVGPIMGSNCSKGSAKDL